MLATFHVWDQTPGNFERKDYVSITVVPVSVDGHLVSMSGQTNMTVGEGVSRQLPTLWPVKKQKGRQDEGNDDMILEISP